MKPGLSSLSPFPPSMIDDTMHINYESLLSIVSDFGSVYLEGSARRSNSQDVYRNVLNVH